jgi:hypothetical protein
MILTTVVEKKSAQLLAPLDKNFEGGAFYTQTEV